MGRVDKRNITLSSELAAAVDDVVANGEYASASEVIGDALT
jgi:antitoxin ParD1/3/4